MGKLWAWFRASQQPRARALPANAKLQDRMRGLDDAEEGRPPRSDQSRAYNQGYSDGLQRLKALGWSRAEHAHGAHADLAMTSALLKLSRGDRAMMTPEVQAALLRRRWIVPIALIPHLYEITAAGHNALAKSPFFAEASRISK